MIDFSRLVSDGTAEGTALRTEAEQRALSGEQTWLDALPTALAGVTVTPRSALTYSPFYACVNVLATDIACLPFGVYQRLPDGSRRELRDDPRDELLRLSPDGVRTAMRFKQALLAHALTWKGGYAEIQRMQSGVPYALHLLDPTTTHSRDDPEVGLVYDLDGGRRAVLAQDVLHFAGLGFNGIDGYELLSVARDVIGLGLAAQTFGATFFGNGAHSGGKLKHPRKLSPEARRNLLDSLQERHGGPYRANKSMLLEEGLEWEKDTVDPEQAQALETRQFQVNDTGRYYRVPPHKMGDFSQAHLSNIEESNLDYLQTALMSWLECIEQECNLKLFSKAERARGLYCEHNMDALLRGNSVARTQNSVQRVNNGLSSRNEERRRENLPPIPDDQGGNLYTVQGAMVPLAQASSPNAPAPSPTPDAVPANAP